MSKLKVLSLFSGIGAFEKALENLGVDFELVGFSEIDKYAIKSYCLLHNVPEKTNLGDVSKVNIEAIPDFDLMTYGFPCQDISISGRKEGFSEGSETRSSLLWQAMRIANYRKPKYLIAENVKNLLGNSFKEDFEKWLKQLDEMGYNTYFKVINASHFEVPQNRERAFVVSIRKDVDDNNFVFPEGNLTKLTIEDILEDEFEQNFYLTYEFKNAAPKGNYIQYSNSGKMADSQAERLYYLDSLMGTLPRSNGGDKTQIIYAKKQEVINDPNFNVNTYTNRKLTPKECFRLMGFTDEDHDLLKENKISKAQLYRQAGNSIVVNVLEAIFNNMFK